MVRLHTLSSFPSNGGRGLPSSSTSRLRQGMGHKAGRGMPKSNGLLHSKHQAVAFPSDFLPPSLHAPRQVLCSPSVTPSPCACSSSAFPGQEGQRVTGKVGSDHLFKAVGRQHPSLDVGLSSQPGDLFCHLYAGASSAPSCSTLLGPPGEGNCKKAPRGSRRGAERDSSPFSFTLSFLKGHAELSRKGNIRTERSIRRRLPGVLPRTGGFRVTDGGK